MGLGSLPSLELGLPSVLGLVSGGAMPDSTVSFQTHQIWKNWTQPLGGSNFHEGILRCELSEVLPGFEASAPKRRGAWCGAESDVEATLRGRLMLTGKQRLSS